MNLDKLISILEELKTHHRSRAELIEMYVTKRLQKSMETYYKEVSQSAEFLAKKDELLMMRKLNRGL